LQEFHLNKNLKL